MRHGNRFIVNGLTPQKRRFAEEYIVDLIASRAYMRAGYSGSPTWGHIQTLMDDPAVQAEIKRLMAARSARLQIDHGWVIEQLLIIYTAAMKMGPEEDTKFAHEKRDLKAASRVVELLGKHVGMFNDRQVHELITKMSDGDLVARVQYILDNQTRNLASPIAPDSKSEQ